MYIIEKLTIILIQLLLQFHYSTTFMEQFVLNLFETNCAFFITINELLLLSASLFLSSILRAFPLLSLYRYCITYAKALNCSVVLFRRNHSHKCWRFLYTNILTNAARLMYGPVYCSFHDAFSFRSFFHFVSYRAYFCIFRERKEQTCIGIKKDDFERETERKEQNQRRFF